MVDKRPDMIWSSGMPSRQAVVTAAAAFSARCSPIKGRLMVKGELLLRISFI